MRFWKLSLPLLASSLCFAAQADRITGTIDSGRMTVLPGHLHRKALPQFDQGRVESSFPIREATLLTVPTASQQKAMNLLLAEQQNPKSPNYHKWITPEQYADRFGLSQNDVKKISAWLKSQGLSVVNVARGRNWIVLSGTAAQIESAFRTEIHRYNVNGEVHFANAIAPSIPMGMSGIVTGIRGLEDFHPKPSSVRKTLHHPLKAGPDYYSSNFKADFVAPGDIETIYDLAPLYSAGIDGTGQKLAIVGQTDVYLADLNDFRSGFGLPALSCTTNSTGVITACNTSNFLYVPVNGVDPGISPSGDVTEADLDLEWSAATAPGAQIIYVNSNNVFNSYYDAIDNKRAPVISLSYGAPCEFADGSSLSADETELKKANSFGITFVNSSGDSGAASCDPGPNTPSNNLAVYGLAVAYPASSPEVTAVGGTAITYPGGFSSTYWGTSNPTNGGTAQNPPLPETSWNDDEELVLLPGSQFNSALAWQENYAIVQSGGGSSNCSVQNSTFTSCVSGFPQPSWQTVTIPGFKNPTRFVPDVSLLGSPNFPGYIFCTPLDQWIHSTSTASSCAPGGTAGITNALALTDPGSNPPNQPAPTVVGGTSASAPVFAGIVTLLNQYLVSKGLQTSGGLGNVNPTLYTLAATPSNGAFRHVTSGDNLVYCEGGTPPAPWPASLQCPGASGTTGTIGYQASNADLTTGYNLVTGLGSVDANALFVAWAATLAPDFQMSASALNPAPVSAGQSTASTITISPIAGSTGMVVNFSPSSCTGLPAGATCSFNPQSVNFDGTNPVITVVTIATAADMAPSGPTTVTVTPTNSAQTSTTVSLTVTATTETFTLTTTAATFPVTVGGTATVNVTVNSSNGFINSSNSTTALPLTYTCSGVPSLPTSEIACNIAPGNGQPTSSTSITVGLVTTPKTAMLRPLHGSNIFYAFLLPGLFGVVFATGSRRRSLRTLGLIVVLGCSTLWLGACGGSSSSVQKNPGTPTGSYVVTINATTGGANPLTSSLNFTLQVQ